MPLSERAEHDSRFERKIDQQAIRDELLDRLGRIEQLAREALARRARTIELEARVAELESERPEWLQAKDDWERQREEALCALEHDRTLLADSWRRLEAAQTKQPASSGRASGAGSLPHKRTKSASQSDQNAESSGETKDPIAESVIREFKTLLRDVQNGNKRSM